MPGFELIDKKERKAVTDVFDKSNGVLFAHGVDARRNHIFRVRDFEKSFATRFGAAKAAACTSGTAAQYIAMKAMGIKPGDEVITQSFTFIATMEAILACGAVPVVVDINDTYNMDPASLENAITNKTKMIVPVHMLGNPAEMDEINAIAKKHNLLVLEDACEALGATYKGKATGMLGDAGVFSLDFGKTITTGEGGMIISDNTDMITRCVQFIDHGHESNPAFPRGRDTASFYGFNFRMMELQAAIGLVQLERLDYIVKKNRTHKKIMKKIIGKSDKISFRRIVDEKGELADTLIFNVETPALAERIVQELSKKGVGTKNVPDAMQWHFNKYFTQIWNNTPYYSDYATHWAKSDQLLSRSISLPVMVGWKKQDAESFAEKVLDVLNAV
jgi:8-amino-3,8-dideoxy-alpha-D-manno-octulosonate transaminase